MFLSAADVRAGIVPGPRLPVLPYHDPDDVFRKRANHWRRFTLGDIADVTVTPEASLIDAVTVTPEINVSAPDTILPTFDASQLQPIDSILPPVGAPTPVQVGTTAPSVDSTQTYLNDFTALAKVAGATLVGVTAAEHGLPPGVTSGITAGTPFGRLTTAGTTYAPFTSSANPLSALLGVGGMSPTTLILLSGVSLVALLAFMRK
jgi:hypothetical protein